MEGYIMNKKRIIYAFAVFLLNYQASSQAHVTFKNQSRDRNVALVMREIMSEEESRQQEAGFNPYHMILLEPGQESDMAYDQEGYGLKNLEIVLIEQFVDFSQRISKPEMNIHQNKWRVALNKAGRKPADQSSMDLSEFSHLDVVHFPIKLQDNSTYTIHNNETDADELPYLTHSMQPQAKSSHCERKNFIAQLNTLLKVGQQHAVTHNKRVQFFVDMEKKFIELRSQTERRNSQGELEYELVPETLVKTHLDIPENLEIKNFIVEDYDEVNETSDRKTSSTWFFITPEGSTQEVIINLLDAKDHILSGKAKPVGLVLNPATAQFKEYDRFQK